MTMSWTTDRPTRGGFYYWQDNSLQEISPNAVRLVQVAKYKNSEGFNCHTLHRGGEHHEPIFDCDLGHEPIGRWAGPLPQPE